MSILSACARIVSRSYARETAENSEKTASGFAVIPTARRRQSRISAEREVPMAVISGKNSENSEKPVVSRASLPERVRYATGCSGQSSSINI
jgi:hypothetical protein